METLGGSLYRRELGSQGSRPKSYRKIYGDRSLIDQLDIVNELDGHSGCVNALSWSKSGALLASGSDDQHLNIHAFQPSSSISQFKLVTTVATGHTANIFSVQFMPHSNDRTVVTAAGDDEVRIFDLEYSGQRTVASAASSIASQGRRARRNVYRDVRYLSDGDTDCRVYRSHSDRVKRIVTESSPYLFLTCSEDGEVRQWDLRQPSSFYPPQRHHSQRSDSSVPPPLISYKRYKLDLNTISCSASQPHYIALGGAHLHAFLHDRRMTGRDRLSEQGRPLPTVDRMTAQEEELMAQATQCVRKFSPTGQTKMKPTDAAHITGCKISDVRPNEMIVSWSGDHIYKFDLIDETKSHSNYSTASKSNNMKQSLPNKKRKRKMHDSQTSQNSTDSAPGSLRARTRAPRMAPGIARHGQSGNGQSENTSTQLEVHTLRTPKQRTAWRIAQAVERIRKALLRTRETDENGSTRYTSTLGTAASILSEIDDAIREWGYPMDPSEMTAAAEQSRRTDRESVRRFVQAAGTLARVLGGRLQTPSASSTLVLDFTSIESRTNERPLSQSQKFGYDFLKAIILWLESGIDALVEGFSRPRTMSAHSTQGERLPIPEESACVESIEEFLIPYLCELSSGNPIVDVDVNQFEVDSNTQLFPNESAAVNSFAKCVEMSRINQSPEPALGEDSHVETLDRQEALQFWGHKVARGILEKMAEVVDFEFTNIAFGGSRLTTPLTDDQKPLVEGVGQSSIETDDEESVDYDDEEHDAESSTDGEGSDTYSLPDEEDGVPASDFARMYYRSALERDNARKNVEADVPCYSNIKSYRGHCNVKTVKDVNYFGLDDEYVVSGSDDGNLFIWDSKSGELVNVLEGDGEVVNVIQGHPYETMLAVSGIDHTIKIFSPDARAREAARFGRQGISAHDATAFSSLSWPARAPLRRRRTQASDAVTSEPAVPETAAQEEDDDYVGSTGLTSRKRMSDFHNITNRNEADRQGGERHIDMRFTSTQLLQFLFNTFGDFDINLPMTN